MTGASPLTLTQILALLGTAATLAAVAILPIRRHAGTLGLLDAPNQRSTHRVVTPRGGGLAIMFAAVVSLALLAAFNGVGNGWILLSSAGLVGIVGAIDDRRGLPPLIRLTVHVLGALLIVVVFGAGEALPFWYAWPAQVRLVLAGFLCLLWLVAVTNFFNFMDGIDGLAGGQAIASCAGVIIAAWAADASALAAVVGGATLGFLVHNWPPARIFMGDSGSGFLGFFLAGLPFLAPEPRRSDAILAAAVGLSPFLLDPIVTLFRRTAAGRNILQAHREHLYQQLVRPGEPAAHVTATYTVVALVLAVLGAVGYRHAEWMWVGPIASLAAFLVVYRRAASGRVS